MERQVGLVRGGRFHVIPLCMCQQDHSKEEKSPNFALEDRLYNQRQALSEENVSESRSDCLRVNVSGFTKFKMQPNICLPQINKINHCLLGYMLLEALSR